MTRKIVILGAGNVATHLTRVLLKEGYNICQIYSRTVESARELGLKTGVHYTNSIDQLYREADVYIFALSDTAIAPLAKKIHLKHNPLLVHTAGSVSLDVFKESSNNYAVLYPLQTFSKNREIDFSNIPICVDANNKKNLKIVEAIASSISLKVTQMSDDERKQVHLAAVFACNFTNYMYSLSEEILNKKNIDFNLLKPLIEETASKIHDLSPLKAQTGPAIRNDKPTMNKHKELLENDNDLKKLYTFISNNIIKLKEKDGIF
jgi:predicted short-subunit dehydrogenase-like oxidoreductase (DUF2520 family)